MAKKLRTIHNVIVIPEDCSDMDMLKPIISAMITNLGSPRAKIQVYKPSVFKGISQVLQLKNINKIVDRYETEADLILLCVDRDADPDTEAKLANLEEKINKKLENNQNLKIFLAENAYQEIEVWLLAGLKEFLDTKNFAWQAIRDERDPKDKYFIPFSKEKGYFDYPNDGRQELAKEAARNYQRICKMCPEVARLEKKIRDWLQNT